MIIQPLTIGGKTTILLHWDPDHDHLNLDSFVENVSKSFPDNDVIVVPFGKPTPGHPSAYVVDWEDPDIKSAVMKMTEHSRRPGSIVPLTKKEMAAITDPSRFATLGA